MSEQSLENEIEKKFASLLTGRTPKKYEKEGIEENIVWSYFISNLDENKVSSSDSASLIIADYYRTLTGDSSDEMYKALNSSKEDLLEYCVRGLSSLDPRTQINAQKPAAKQNDDKMSVKMVYQFYISMLENNSLAGIISRVENASDLNGIIFLDRMLSASGKGMDALKDGNISYNVIEYAKSHGNEIKIIKQAAKPKKKSKETANAKEKAAEPKVETYITPQPIIENPGNINSGQPSLESMFKQSKNNGIFQQPVQNGNYALTLLGDAASFLDDATSFIGSKIKTIAKGAAALCVIGALLYGGVKTVGFASDVWHGWREPDNTSTEESGSSAGTVKKQTSKNEYNVLAALAEKDSGIEYIIYVNKNVNKTGLFRVRSGSVEKDPMHVWRSTDGKGGEGPKQYKDDYKTPEGVYQIDRMGRSDAPLFGTYFIRMNYPNNIDAAKERDGGEEGQGILICGTYLDERIDAIRDGRDVTNGAIVLNDDDMTQLYNEINGHQESTLIVIEGKTRINDSYLNSLRLR